MSDRLRRYLVSNFGVESDSYVYFLQWLPYVCIFSSDSLICVFSPVTHMCIFSSVSLICVFSPVTHLYVYFLQWLSLSVSVSRGAGGRCADLARFCSERSRTYNIFSCFLLHGSSYPTERSILPGRHTVHERGLDDLNHLKAKRRLLYLKTRSVPRCKRFSSGL